MQKAASWLLGAGMVALVGTATPLAAKTLVYCSEGSPENFTPAINTTGTSFDAARPIYDQLVEFERGTTKVGPGLAESWEVSPDALTFTFKLRKGVKFHPATSTPMMSCGPSTASGSPTTPTPRFPAASMIISPIWICRSFSRASTRSMTTL